MEFRRQMWIKKMRIYIYIRSKVTEIMGHLFFTGVLYQLHLINDMVVFQLEANLNL